jgi:hypothetical protein
MENVAEIVALLRKQADLECQILNAHSIAVGAEQELDVTGRRLATHPQALKAVLADGSGTQAHAGRRIRAGCDRARRQHRLSLIAHRRCRM